MANTKAAEWYHAAGGGDGVELIKKSVVFDGAAGSGAIGTVALFTVTGLCRIKVIAVCKTSLTEEGAPGGATIEVGVSGDTAILIAQTAALDIDVGEIWHDATPDALHESSDVFAPFLINGEDIIATVGTDEIDGGEIEFIALVTPLSTDSVVTAA